MDNIIVGEGLTFAVFEPFLGGLVAPDVGFPRFEGYICEILCIVDIYMLPLSFCPVFTHFISVMVLFPAMGKEVIRACSWGLSSRCSSRRCLPMVA